MGGRWERRREGQEMNAKVVGEASRWGCDWGLKNLIFAPDWEATQSLQQTRNLGAREMDIKGLGAVSKGRASTAFDFFFQTPNSELARKMTNADPNSIWPSDTHFP